MQSTPRTMARAVPPGPDRHCGVCADCGAPTRNAAICDACEALNRNASASDPFALLGLPESFDLDPSVLTTAYRSIARRVHPDRFTMSNDETRALAERLSADINRAQEILADPVRRADFLLVKAGGPTSASLRDVPGALLAETMMLREEIESAKSAGDTAALERFRSNIETRRTEALARIAGSATKLPTCDETQMAALRRELNAMKYYGNLLAELQGDPLGRAG